MSSDGFSLDEAIDLVKKADEEAYARGYQIGFAAGQTYGEDLIALEQEATLERTSMSWREWVGFFVTVLVTSLAASWLVLYLALNVWWQS